MTNGEKIKEIFPNIIKYGNILIDDTGALQKNILFDDTWWNSEYKEPTTKNDLEVDKTDMIDKSNFSQEQYKADLQSAYDCGYKQAKNDLGVDCIDRQATLDAIIKRLGIKNETYLLEAERAIYQQILAMPSVTPIRLKGHWIDIDATHSKCDRCGAIFEIASANGEANYCPNCGCRMVESQESEDVEAHPINENITKGFEEFTKMMFRQGQAESDIEKRKPCINYSDGCEEWAGCPCVYYKSKR